MSKMTGKLIFVIDSKPQDIQWIKVYFDENNYSSHTIGMSSSVKNRTVSWRRIILFYKYIQTAIRAIRQSKPADVIISINFIIGAFAAFFCKLSGIKRTILSTNMISHEKGMFNKIVRKIVYNSAFKYPGFYVTVNSKELLESYAAEFNLKKDHFFILFDSIRTHYEKQSYKNGNGSVFCGGEAMRDWDSLFKAAELLPSTKFNVIARKKFFEPSVPVPENVTTHFDTDFDFFYQQLKDSSIVAMPLTTTAPAGLIVMIRAALLSKPVIVTSTSSTRNYIENGVNGILLEKGDYQTLTKEISFLLEHPVERESMCRKMNETIQSFSVENFHKKLEEIVTEIKQ